MSSPVPLLLLLLSFISSFALRAESGASHLSTSIRGVPSLPSFDASAPPPFPPRPAVPLDEGAESAFISELLKLTGVDADELESLYANRSNTARGGEDASFLEVEAHAEAEKVHGYCEICMRMLQMYQRGIPDVCSGLTDTYFISVRSPCARACVYVLGGGLFYRGWAG